MLYNLPNFIQANHLALLGRPLFHGGALAIDNAHKVKVNVSQYLHILRKDAERWQPQYFNGVPKLSNWWQGRDQ